MKKGGIVPGQKKHDGAAFDPNLIPRTGLQVSVIDCYGKHFESAVNEELKRLQFALGKTVLDVKYAISPGDTDADIPDMYSAMIIYED